MHNLQLMILMNEKRDQVNSVKYEDKMKYTKEEPYRNYSPTYFKEKPYRNYNNL